MFSKKRKLTQNNNSNKKSREDMLDIKMDNSNKKLRENMTDIKMNNSNKNPREDNVPDIKINNSGMNKSSILDIESKSDKKLLFADWDHLFNQGGVYIQFNIASSKIVNRDGKRFRFKMLRCVRQENNPPIEIVPSKRGIKCIEWENNLFDDSKFNKIQNGQLCSENVTYVPYDDNNHNNNNDNRIKITSKNPILFEYFPNKCSSGLLHLTTPFYLENIHKSRKYDELRICRYQPTWAKLRYSRRFPPQTYQNTQFNWRRNTAHI